MFIGYATMTNDNTLVKAWLQFFCNDDGLPKSAIAEAIANNGITLQSSDPYTSNDMGIIFFDNTDQQLFEFLRGVSSHGRKRVLAIAASRAILANGAIWRLLHAGASNVFSWDHSTNPAIEIKNRLERYNAVDQLVRSPLVKDNLVGQSPAWISVLRQIVEVAKFTDANILITGETGTGKELIARLIHTLDSRKEERDLVVLDCTTIVPELSGSEFFGHERGAFTSAVSSRDGAFALANDGTLFLDEVGELPLVLQAQLLRVVQEHTYKRVGGNTWQSANFRLVCATNRDLMEEVKQDKFRQDFYYRIANWTCRLPPLRERPEDIIPLAEHFMKILRPDEDPPELDESVLEYLMKRAYPGNVRDLRQLVTRLTYRHIGPGPITAGDIPEEDRPSPESLQTDWCNRHFESAIHHALSVGIGLKEIGRVAEETAVRIAVSNENGNLQRAARKLGVTDRALQMRRAARRQNEQSQEADQSG